MDLSEIRGSGAQRHPWETARAEAIERILGARNIRPSSILDVGCGDGFTGEILTQRFGAASMWGIDVNLSDADCQARSRPGARYAQDISAVHDERFGLGLLCDVIEHVPDDRALVRTVLSRLEPDGYLLVTVPSFQALFSSHDVALRHYRRYSLAQLTRAVEDAGASVVDGGYLFGSLLPVRLLQKAVEAVKPRSVTPEASGVGGWSAPALVTKSMELAFRIDNGLLLGLSSRRIKLPGLSSWVLCKKRS